MLLDKSGLRKGKAPKGASHPGKKAKFNSRKPVEMTPEQRRQNDIRNALEFGIGYDTYKKEVDAIRAERLRSRLEKFGEAKVIDNIG